MPVRIVTDSVASLPPSLAHELDIDVVSLWVNDGATQQRDLDIDLDAFYRRLADIDHIPTSSQPSPEDLVAAFRGPVDAGDDVVGVFISGDMSGTAEAARLAAQMVREQVPTARIEIVDSRSNSMQEGFAAIAAARAAKAGSPLEWCVEAATDTIRCTRYLFTPATLEYLRRGGRIGGASALLGQLLQICPILTVEDGATTTYARVRTHAKALSTIAEKFAADIAEFGYADAVVHYIAERDPAEQWAREFIDSIAGCEVPVIPVSPVIGVHVGPAVAVVYQTKEPMRP
jgi:DegV family protein with EDD domain